MTITELNEQALIKPKQVGLPMERDFKNDFNKLKLIADKIQPLNNKLYSDIGVFYLTDQFDNYLGHIEYEHLDKDKIKVNSTYSKQKGFYELMFKYILIKTDIHMIFGDDEQSEDAIHSWKKQLSKYQKKVYNTETNQVEEFDDSKENLYWTHIRGPHKKYLVGLSESDNYIKECYENIIERIEKRKSLGRITDFSMDYLVRHFDIDEQDSFDMINYLKSMESGNY